MSFVAGIGIFLFSLTSREAVRSTPLPNQVILWSSTIHIMRPGHETHNLSPFLTELASAEAYLHFPIQPNRLKLN
jgi:hypothetical protein